MKLKRGNDKTSRGYCGYYTSPVTGKKFYMRSKQEFIVANWLDILNITFSTESMVYDINGIKYKPDFFVYDKNNNLEEIIETKYSKKEAIEYEEKFSRFFEMLGIKYVVFYNKHTNNLIKKFSLQEKIDKWIDENVDIIHDMRGSKNPHFGCKHSEKSLNLIGVTSKEKWKDETFRKYCISKIKEKMSEPDVRKKISDKAKERWLGKEEERIKYSEQRRKYDRVEIYKKCPYCNKEKKVIHLYDRETKIFIKEIGSVFCNNSCTALYKNAIKYEKRKGEQKELYMELKKKLERCPYKKEFEQYCVEKNKSFDLRYTYKKFGILKEVCGGKTFTNNKV
jgi:hypothetical protein